MSQNLYLRDKPSQYYGHFQKKDVDYDLICCISTHDRYDKVIRILKALFSQPTQYKFKVILFNDGSSDERYDSIVEIYPEIEYHKNLITGGKFTYWKVFNFMWKESLKYKFYGILHLDDDFILCENFLNILMDEFFLEKEKDNSKMIFSFHLFSPKINKTGIESMWFDENQIFVDGGCLIDFQFLEKINFKLDDIEHRLNSDIYTSTFVYVRLKEHLINLEMKIHRFKKSLVYHDGNDDSKLHSQLREKNKVYTKKFIDNEIENFNIKKNKRMNINKYKNDGWGLSRRVFTELERILNTIENPIIVEFGSGTSTKFLVDYVNLHTGKIYSFDNNYEYCSKIIDSKLILKVKKLVECSKDDYDRMFLNKKYERGCMKDLEKFDMTKNTYFYDIDESDLPDNIDLVIVDGPQGNGRTLSYLHLQNKMKKPSYVLIDDSSREDFLPKFNHIFPNNILLSSCDLNKNKWMSGGIYRLFKIINV